MPINIVLKIYMYLPEEVLPYVLETVKKAKKRVSECTIKWFVKLSPILEDKVGAVFTLPETGLFSLHTAHYCRCESAKKKEENRGISLNVL